MARQIPAMIIDAFTDYPIAELGDVDGEIAPIRAVTVVDYDGSLYCQVLVPGVAEPVEVKRWYLYSSRGRTWDDGSHPTLVFPSRGTALAAEGRLHARMSALCELAYSVSLGAIGWALGGFRSCADVRDAAGLRQWASEIRTDAMRRRLPRLSAMILESAADAIAAYLREVS